MYSESAEKLYIYSFSVCRSFCKITKWLCQNRALFKCGTTVSAGCKDNHRSVFPCLYIGGFYSFGVALFVIVFTDHVMSFRTPSLTILYVLQ